LPKDAKALCKFAKELGYQAPLLRAVLAVNEAQARPIAQLALSALVASEGKKVALLGLAFKPNTDDLREAPSLKIAKQLMAAKGISAQKGDACYPAVFPSGCSTFCFSRCSRIGAKRQTSWSLIYHIWRCKVNLASTAALKGSGS
jgi:hypothetical protein